MHLCLLDNILIALCSATKLSRKQHKLGSITYPGPPSDLTRPRDNERGCGYDHDKRRLTGKIWVERTGLIQSSWRGIHSRKTRAHSPIHPGLTASRVPSKLELYINATVGVILTQFPVSYPVGNGL